MIPLRRSGVEYHRTLSHLPQAIPLCSAPKARVVISWWDRVVHIWRLNNRLDDVLSTADDEAAVDQNRKLLGRVLVKGDLSITAAAISQDGTLLVVSTTSEIKAFQLQQPPTPSDKLRISKIDMPAPWTAQGATSIVISPDGLWICGLQAKSRIAVAKVVRTEAKLSINAKPLSLARLKRDIPRHLVVGGLGGYDRRATHAAFSADSKMLAVADLAGYIDTWVLRGGGDTSGDANSIEDDDALSSSSSSSEDESPDEEGSADGGDRWLRNPKARLVPKLPAAPVVLTLSDRMSGPRSRDSDAERDDYVLLAITASSEFLAFHPLQGKLTSWSHRIKYSRLPLEYQNIRDLAKGALWQGPRLWIYGSSFLFMIDTSVEPEDKAATTIVPLDSDRRPKRKRGADTGAGARMKEGVLAPRNVRIGAEDKGEIRMVDVEMGDADGDSDSSDLLQPQYDRRVDAKMDGETLQPRRWWCTYKYRPILGIVPFDCQETVNSDKQEGSSENRPLEVALVERPTWDLELPARYAGDDVWDR